MIDPVLNSSKALNGCWHTLWYTKPVSYRLLWLLPWCVWPVLIGRHSFVSQIQIFPYTSASEYYFGKNTFLFVYIMFSHPRKKNHGFYCHVPSSITLHQPVTNWYSSQYWNFILKTTYHMMSAAIIGNRLFPWLCGLICVLLWKWILVFIKIQEVCSWLVYLHTWNIFHWQLLF